MKKQNGKLVSRTSARVLVALAGLALLSACATTSSNVDAHGDPIGKGTGPGN